MLHGFLLSSKTLHKLRFLFIREALRGTLKYFKVGWPAMQNRAPGMFVFVFVFVFGWGIVRVRVRVRIWLLVRVRVRVRASTNVLVRVRARVR